MKYNNIIGIIDVADKEISLLSATSMIPKLDLYSSLKKSINLVLELFC